MDVRMNVHNNDAFFTSLYRSSSGKNGYTSHHHNIVPHGLLIVPNGYNHPSSSDPSLPYNDHDCHTTDGNHHDGFTSHGAKTNDKNCNYIFQNGEHHDQTLDINSNNSHECKYTVSYT